MKITLKGNPKSNNHIYRNHGHIRYMTKEGKELKENYQWQARTQYEFSPNRSLMDIEIELFFGDMRKRDVDNYWKILLDSLTGILWLDDSQIFSMKISKHIDKLDPRIEITI